MDCSCDRCQGLCRTKPGWFTPQQIEPVARKLSLTIEELFKRHLTIDAVLIADKDKTTAIYVLAPAIAGNKSGAISDPTARGTCVWFKDGKCAIHEIKPAECSAVDHSTSALDADLLRASILKQWLPHKKFIQGLYGKKLKLPAAVKEGYRRAKKRSQETPPSGGDTGNGKAV